MSTITSALKEGAIVATGPGDRTKALITVRTPQWAEANGLRFPMGGIHPQPLWFVGETWTGLRYFGRLAYRLDGDPRTVRRFGLDCPAVYIYNVDTVAVCDEERETFALWGVLGARVRTPGPLFTRPENVLVAV